MNMLAKLLGGIKNVGRFVDKTAQRADRRDAKIDEETRLSIMMNNPELYRILYVPQITDEERRAADEEWYNNVGWQTAPDYLIPQKPSVEQIMRQLDGYFDYPKGSNYGFGSGA